MLGLGLGFDRYKSIKIDSAKSPDTVGALSVWYDFTDTTQLLDTGGGPISTGETIGTVLDKSGNGYNATQHSGNSNRPLWTENLINGLGAADTHNAQGVLQNTSYSIAQGYTALVVASRSQTISGYWIGSSSSSGRGSFGPVSGAYRIYSGPPTLNGGTIDSNWNYYIVYFNGASTVIRKNGSIEVSGIAGTHTRIGMSLMSGWDGTNVFRGYLAEVALWEGILTTQEVEQIESYAQSKYDL